MYISDEKHYLDLSWKTFSTNIMNIHFCKPAEHLKRPLVWSEGKDPDTGIWSSILNVKVKIGMSG